MRNVYERVFVPSTGDHHAGQGKSGVSGDCRAISGGIDASVPELTRLSGGQRLGNTGVVRHRSYPCPQRGERGAITAEFAMVLPVAMVLMILLLSLTRVVTTSMACQDAASAAVRELVITRTPAGSAEAQRIASTAAIAVAGKGTTAAVSEDGGLVTVRTQCPVVPGATDILPTMVNGSASGAGS